MSIEIKKPNHLKELLHRIHSKLEDLLFNIILRIPERFIPSFLMAYLESYTTKRLNQLKQDTTKLKWKEATLQKAVEEISNQQQT